MTWTGANDIQLEGNFVWESSGLPVTYFNWLGGEPNNAGGNFINILRAHFSYENLNSFSLLHFLAKGYRRKKLT